MSIIISKATQKDLNEINQIYEESIDWLIHKGIHQWKKGVYPTEKTAREAFSEDCLYCCWIKHRIAATFILNEKQSPEYRALNWKYANGKVLVLHTLVVTPDAMGKGIARRIMQYILQYANENAYHAIRLDVYPGNTAAVSLYLSSGFEYAGDVFFDIKEPGYERFECYEKLADLK